MRAAYDGVVIAAPVTIPYVRYSTRDAHWFLGRALAALVKRAQIKKDELDGLCVSSFTLFPDSAVGLTQHFGLSPRWLDHIPMGGASGVVALRRAARAVQAGDAEIVACIAGDTNHVNSFRQNLANFSRFARDAVYPLGAGGPNMSFALLTSYYMRQYGIEARDFGKLCVAQRDNALKFPHALFKKPLTLDEYLNARPVADPLKLFDCVMPCAGAEGFLVMSEERAKNLGLPFARILGTIERHNAFPDDPMQLRGGWALDRDDLYAQAGAGAGRHGFRAGVRRLSGDQRAAARGPRLLPEGRGRGLRARAIRSRSAARLPLNTSGGQLSVGQAGAAGGYLGMTEAVRQLTGETLGAKVENARLGLVSGFGMINYDRGLCSGAAVLGRA